VSGWRSLAYATARPLLFRFEPERIHRLTLDALRIAGGNAAGRGVLRVAGGALHRPRPWVEVMGVRFRNRIGLGAGFDKDGVALPGWAALGFGFAEVGTVTPLAQPGSERPRLFRLAEDQALVNRMGFNNHGAAALARNVMLARRRLPRGFAVGVNVGRGRDTPAEAAHEDYLAAYRLVAPVADYLAINLSSPNTPGLRDLQEPGWIGEMLRRLAEAAQALRRPPPLVVKLSPDLDPSALDGALDAIADAPAAGVILANSSIARDGLRSPQATERGGLSGPPLLPGMLTAVARARDRVGTRLVIIASGGVAAACDVDAAYAAGADLVQLWTGLVYAGPGLVGESAVVPWRAR
jgi:dihydroorotate dehydrogenase